MSYYELYVSDYMRDFSTAFPILGYLPPNQDKNSEYPRGDYWAWNGQNYFKMFYDVAAFTFNPTLWFALSPPTHWRLDLGPLGEK